MPDFDALLEFQGADDVSPIPSGATPDQADGLTPWVSAANITTLNFKRYFRWRWRFFVKDGWGEDPGDPDPLPLPTVFDLSIPFVIVTLGLFGILIPVFINTVLLKLTDELMTDFELRGWTPAFLMGILFAIGGILTG